MIELLKLIFFLKTTLLTQAPIDIEKNNPFIYKGELDVLNGGAHISINTTHKTKCLTPKSFSRGITDNNDIKRRHKIIDEYNIIITAKDINNNNIYFYKPYLYIYKNKLKISISIRDVKDIKNIYKLKISSDKLLDNIKISWVNGAK